MKISFIISGFNDFFVSDPMAGVMAAMACASSVFFFYTVSLFKNRKKNDREKGVRAIGFDHDLFSVKELISGLRSFSLFFPEKIKAGVSICSGKRNGRKWQVFDLNDKGCAVLTDAGALPFPRIHLLPRNCGLRLSGEMVSLESMTFAGQDVFNRRYLLLGLDRESVAAAFSPALIKFFERKEQDAAIEISQGKIVYYRIGRRVTAQELPFFLDEAEMVYQHFSRAWEYSFVQI